jgi:hypothetical protein
MEMIDIRAAIQVLDNYTILLEGNRKMVSQHLGKSQGDTEIATHVASLQESLKELWRDSAIASIALYRRLQMQVDLLINYPAEVAELTRAQTRHAKELHETGEVLRKINPAIELDRALRARHTFQKCNS